MLSSSHPYSHETKDNGSVGLQLILRDKNPIPISEKFEKVVEEYSLP